MVGGRVLLINGVQHVCAAAVRGYRQVPCLLRRPGRVEETGLNLRSSLFRPYIRDRWWRHPHFGGAPFKLVGKGI